LNTLTSKGKRLNLATPVVMGILNATPNSFHNTGQPSDVDSLLQLAQKMLNDGATILDIGGASTKPGEPLIAPTEELKRIIPVITAIRKAHPDVWISVDTYNAAVAEAAVHAGSDIVNDISAGTFDKDMYATVARLKVPYIAMHIQGTPATMQQDPQYNHTVAEVRRFLRHVIDNATAAGITDIVIDPGFGFGKTVAHNYELLKYMGTFATLGRPVLAGVSRKSLICKPLKVNPEHALNGTTALNMAALINGANILRVHDVKEAVQTVALYNLFS
jgi:dihydropteroate synthase